MSQHSLAPWEWQGYEPAGSNPISGDYDAEPMAILDGNDEIIAYIDHDGHSMEVAIANANMLSASLDLFAACKAFATWFDGWCHQANCCAHTGLPIHEQALAAIKKASEGQS